MQKKSLLSLVLLMPILLFSQLKPVKKIIDTTTAFNWPEIGLAYQDDVNLSPDGKYFSYRLKKRWVADGQRILQPVDGKGKTYLFPLDIKCFFSKDSKHFIYYSQNKLTDLSITSGEVEIIDNVKNILIPDKKKGELLIYQLEGARRQLVVKYLQTPEKSMVIDSVSKYALDKKEEHLAILLTKEGHTGKNLRWFDLQTGQQYEIAASSEEEIEAFDFDNSGTRLVFTKVLRQNKSGRTIWLFDALTHKVHKKADSRNAGLSIGEFISSKMPFFSDDARYIFFRVEKSKPVRKETDYVKLDIWNYKDLKPKNACFYPLPDTYAFSASVQEEKLVRLENDSIRLLPSYRKVGDYVITANYIGDQYWKEKVAAGRHFWLVSLKDGSQARFNIVSGCRQYYYSPNGKYIVYGDSVGGKLDYYSFNTLTKETKNLSKYIPTDHLTFTTINGDKLVGPNFLNDVVGWLSDENAVLIYGSFDIFKFYLSGNQKPENITNGYGYKHHTRFALAYEGSLGENLYNSKDTLLLTAFNGENKYNGFYSKCLSENSHLDSLSMQPWIINAFGKRIMPDNDHMMYKGMPPLKATDTDLWLVKCNSTNSAPNYFITNDLKHYRRLTDIQPHRDYNWYTTELVHWQQYDGKRGNGILYKPENFDSKKKYPVIIYHYRELSHKLYHYDIPEPCSDIINIPWFVNRGYIVMAPDVFVAENGSGPGAFNAVASAADWLKTQSYVDENKIGLAGHSQAGFQTDYIVAHTNVFAAALSGAGGADAITSSFITRGCGNLRFYASELRMGTIWEHLDLYLENSPLHIADKIKTPLLLFHCMKDEAVPWELSVQLFIALWRLGSPAWLLQYDEGNHSLLTKRDVLDYTTRLEQFFGHYLKGQPPAEWMTKGVPRELKGIETGLKLIKE
ncbi:prolyl oligopeptidase family serine peptidase [Filimonas effusa]|uniref:S9 family peptidase n=1 Tax=Filimonas effusa TaxID=2508721 RepID=A0A4V1M9M5_9BACT|nr:prolyl oligopeptidase family serine peptidase [Filimonas effusa]RXK81730.1 S9 family peptidase [Filimonas effusa]